MADIIEIPTKDNENVVTGQFGHNPSPYRQLEELHEAFNEVLEGYHGRISIAGVVGVLEILKAELIRDGFEDLEE